MRDRWRPLITRALLQKNTSLYLRREFIDVSSLHLKHRRTTMNLLILATLFSVVLAEKSPRLKFTVMGKTLFFFSRIVSVCIGILWRVLLFYCSQSLMVFRTKAEIANLIFPSGKQKWLRNKTSNSDRILKNRKSQITMLVN